MLKLGISSKKCSHNSISENDYFNSRFNDIMTETLNGKKKHLLSMAGPSHGSVILSSPTQNDEHCTPPSKSVS